VELLITTTREDLVVWDAGVKLASNVQGKQRFGWIIVLHV
jgi:hypothetical protein